MAFLTGLYLFLAETAGIATGIFVFLIFFQYVMIFMIGWIKSKLSHEIKFTVPEWLEAINYMIDIPLYKLEKKPIPTTEQYHDSTVMFWKEQGEILLLNPEKGFSAAIIFTFSGIILGTIFGVVAYYVFCLAGLLLQFVWPFLLIAGIVSLLVYEAQPLFTLIGILRTLNFYTHRHEGDEAVNNNSLPRF